ncbi:WAP four-disulfide core domain protein 1 isoform X4 [Festucalex cinctus]
MLPERACEVPGCRSDSECERHKRCCYNGCIYACLESVQPPPVLDWLVQPKPRWLGGNGWLLDGPEEVLQAEACSTTEDGDEPLHCPTGYECHIINPGNPAAGIPNRGQCIKQRANSDGRGLRHKFFKDYKDYLGNDCLKSGTHGHHQTLGFLLCDALLRLYCNSLQLLYLKTSFCLEAIVRIFLHESLVHPHLQCVRSYP